MAPSRLQRVSSVTVWCHNLWWLGLALASAPGAAGAQATVSGSPDVHLEQAGTVLRPGDVARDLEAPVPAPIDLGPLPEGADVIAYSPGITSSDRYFVLGHTLTLPGGVTARPRDIVAWDGASYLIGLDGGGSGIPDGVAIDAFSYDDASGTFWFSFDTTFDLAGTVIRDADVVDGYTLSPVFDATAAGVPAGMDVDGVSFVPASQDLLLSFDVGGMLGGVTFADEDVLRYDPVGDSWTLAVDTSATDPDWEPADLDALHVVPEPGEWALLASGAAMLSALARRRERRAARAGMRGRDVVAPLRDTDGGPPCAR